MKIMQSQAALVGIGGSDPNNVMVVGWGPTIWHWNGLNWQRLSSAEGLLETSVVLWGVWTDGSEAFIVGDDGSRAYVLHGR